MKLSVNGNDTQTTDPPSAIVEPIVRLRRPQSHGIIIIITAVLTFLAGARTAIGAKSARAEWRGFLAREQRRRERITVTNGYRRKWDDATAANNVHVRTSTFGVRVWRRAPRVAGARGARRVGGGGGGDKHKRARTRARAKGCPVGRTTLRIDDGGGGDRVNAETTNGDDSNVFNNNSIVVVDVVVVVVVDVVSVAKGCIIKLW